MNPDVVRDTVSIVVEDVTLHIIAVVGSASAVVVGDMNTDGESSGMSPLNGQRHP